LDEEALAKIIWRYGEERFYKKIAHGIVYYRSQLGEIVSTKQLADIIATIVREARLDSLDRSAHVATKTFQAIRIFVNNELNELYNGINLIKRFLKPGAKLAVISFHSLEDRIVKSHFHENEFNESEVAIKSGLNKKVSMNLFDPNEQMKQNEKCLHKYWTPVSRKVVTASDVEVSENPRARSAKLRVAIKNKEKQN